MSIKVNEDSMLLEINGAEITAAVRLEYLWRVTGWPRLLSRNEAAPRTSGWHESPSPAHRHRVVPGSPRAPRSHLMTAPRARAQTRTRKLPSMTTRGEANRVPVLGGPITGYGRGCAEAQVNAGGRVRGCAGAPPPESGDGRSHFGPAYWPYERGPSTR